jgi:hypothetical protein
MTISRSVGRQIARGCFLLVATSLAFVLGGVGSRAGDQDRVERKLGPISDELQEASDQALKRFEQASEVARMLGDRVGRQRAELEQSEAALKRVEAMVEELRVSHLKLQFEAKLQRDYEEQKRRNPPEEVKGPRYPFLLL